MTNLFGTFVLITSLLIKVTSANYSSSNSKNSVDLNSWPNFSSEIKNVWKFCEKVSKTENPPLWKCLNRKSLKIFDQLLQSDSIPIMDNLRLIRQEKTGNIEQIGNRTWSEYVIDRIGDTLNSHLLQIDLTSKSTARRRHHQQMLPMMVFGVTAFGMIIIPMGFQFLAVLGGKALLLAKMALFLATMNGYKRVAGGPYGFVPEPYFRSDRSDNVGPRGVV